MKGVDPRKCGYGTFYSKDGSPNCPLGWGEFLNKKKKYSTRLNPVFINFMYAWDENKYLKKSKKKALERALKKAQETVSGT